MSSRKKKDPQLADIILLLKAIRNDNRKTRKALESCCAELYDMHDSLLMDYVKRERKLRLER